MSTTDPAPVYAPPSLPDGPPPVPRLALSVGEAAQAIGLSEREVWRRIADGALPVVRIGRRTLIRVAALDAFLAARAAPVTTASEPEGDCR